MVITQMNVHKAKTHLSKILDQAMAGEEVVIMRSGEPLVRLTPAGTAPAPRVLGTARGELVDPAGFNEPLPDDVLTQFEGTPG